MVTYKATARANKPHGYKAVIETHDERGLLRSEVLGQRTLRAAPNHPTREAAIASAKAVLAHRLREAFVAGWLYANRTPEGRRRSREEALAAYKLKQEG